MEIIRVTIRMRSYLEFVNGKPYVHTECGEPIYSCSNHDQDAFNITHPVIDEYEFHASNETTLTFEVKAVAKESTGDEDSVIM